MYQSGLLKMEDQLDLYLIVSIPKDGDAARPRVTHVPVLASVQQAKNNCRHLYWKAGDQGVTKRCRLS